MDTELLQTAFKMTVALGVVLLTFGLAVMIARRFAGTSKGFLKKSGKANHKPLEILAYQNMGPGKGIYLIRCLDQKILIGATNHNINTLTQVGEVESETAFESSLAEKVGADDSLKNEIKGQLREISRI
jgi:flagellar biogenesis protein FliO